MVAPRPDEFTPTIEVKLTDAVTVNFRNNIRRRLRTAYDFHQSMIAPEVTFQVMREEMDKLEKEVMDKIAETHRIKNPVIPATTDDRSEDEDEEDEDGF